MNLLVTGANGQLGNEMRVLSVNYPQHTWFFTDIQELDITDSAAVSAFVTANRIDAIVNCAAYTNVDRAEEDEQTAWLINAEAPRNLAKAAAEMGALLIHVSTDYVFDGNSCLPYRETDTPSPATAYGRTKLAGEKAILEVCPNAVIIRTAWLYSSFGNNFVKTMLRLGRERDSLSVVYDQIGTPTYAADLAQAIMVVIEKRQKSKDKSLISNDSEENHIRLSSFDFERSGLSADNNIYHFSNLGVCSWYDFTCEIFRQTGIDCRVVPIRSEQYPAKTPRPHYSVLDKQKIQSDFCLSIPHWTDSLRQCLTLLS